MDFPDYWGINPKHVKNIKPENIYPNADADEVIANAKKGPDRFMKQYVKGDFIYTIQKPPFKEMSIIAIHKPTETIFGWSKYFLGWNKLGDIDMFSK